MSHKKIQSVIDKLERHIEKHDISNSKISKSGVGWHIDHSLKVINNVIAALQKSNPNTYKNNFSLAGKLFLKLGFFPRGRGKAPKHIKPPELILKKDLISQLQSAKVNLEIIKVLDKNSYFEHPLFGNINLKRVGRFLETHTNHHLKIINDILVK